MTCLLWRDTAASRGAAAACLCLRCVSSWSDEHGRLRSQLGRGHCGSGRAQGGAARHRPGSRCRTAPEGSEKTVKSQGNQCKCSGRSRKGSANAVEGQGKAVKMQWKVKERQCRCSGRSRKGSVNAVEGQGKAMSHRALRALRHQAVPREPGAGAVVGLRVEPADRRDRRRKSHVELNRHVAARRVAVGHDVPLGDVQPGELHAAVAAGIGRPASGVEDPGRRGHVGGHAIAARLEVAVVVVRGVERERFASVPRAALLCDPTRWCY